MEWDEFSLFVSSVLVVFAVVRRIVVTAMRRNRVQGETARMTLRATLAQFRAEGLRGDEIILLALLLPSMQLVLFYSLLMLDLDARFLLARPAVFTSNVILAIYFLNGRLTNLMRGLLLRWKR